MKLAKISNRPFLPIFGEKNGVFLKNNAIIKFLHNLALLRVKTPIFSPNF
jgi:hypothetical protein